MKRKIRLNNLVNDILNACIVDSFGCFIYPVNTNFTRINGTPVSFSKIIYDEFVGRLPYKSRIRRKCKNGKCLNPEHMISSLPEDKFFSFVAVKNIDECWEWTGSKDGGGYGIFPNSKFKETKSHRIAWEIEFGEVPDSLWVLHECDNASCVNPYHLFLGTNADNIQDKVKKERQSRLFGERNGMSKMNKEKVQEMRSLYATRNYSYRDLVRLFNISQAQVARIIKRESWLWVD